MVNVNILLTAGFNKACNNISSSYINVEYESTSDILLRTTAKRDLLHL